MGTLQIGRENEYETLPIFWWNQLVSKIKALPRTRDGWRRMHNHAVNERREYAYEGLIAFTVRRIVRRHKNTCAEKEEDNSFFDDDDSIEYVRWESAVLECRRTHAITMQLRYEQYEKVRATYRGHTVLSADTIDCSAEKADVSQSTVRQEIVDGIDYSRHICGAIMTPFDVIVRRYLQNGGLEKVIQRATKTVHPTVQNEPKPLPTFVEIRQMTRAAQITYEEAVELCKAVVDTIYQNRDVLERKVSQIDEERLCKLMDDYAMAADNDDVDFLRLFVRDPEQGILVRETVFVNLVLRNADPAAVKMMAERTVYEQMIKRFRSVLMLPCYQSA